MRGTRSITVSFAVAGVMLASGPRADAGCLINTIGTQIFVTCDDPQPATHWRAGVDDGAATRWRSSGVPTHGRARDQVRRFEEVGSLMVEVEPNPDIHMLKIR